jgi:hypothetical protein
VTEERGIAGREEWAHAKTLDDLGELMARWIEGALQYRPAYYGGEPAPETDPLRETLAAYNRRGFVTTDSQPSIRINAKGFGQRAWVSGYSNEDLARRLGALGLWTDLLVFLFPPGDYLWGYGVPVTIEEFRPFTWVGRYLGNAYRQEYWAKDCSREALLALMRAWEVHIIDPRWGREAYLWEHVSAVLLEDGPVTDKPFSVTLTDPDRDTDFIF